MSPYFLESKESMPTKLIVEAIVSSKGQVTLPAAIREKLGITTGSRIQFELRGSELVVRPELPMSTYRGMLKPYSHLFTADDLEIAKDADRAV